MPDFYALRCIFFLMAGLVCLPDPASARDTPQASPTTTTEHRWTGQWSAEGLAFVVQARTSAGRLLISAVEPADQGWVTRNGRINDGTATIEVEYQGVQATALIQLMEDNTAIARTLSCQPDYHVICTLARNQQARFHRSPAPAEE